MTLLGKLSFKIKGKEFYLAYFFIICLYIVLLRMQSVPAAFTYSLYALSIVVAISAFFKKGILHIGQKSDVKLLFCFFIYYIISSLLYVGRGDIPEVSWLIKDWLYSLLPILFYILVRLSKFQIEEQLFLKVTLYSIFFLDIIALTIFAFPGSFIGGLIDLSVLSDETYSYALTGVCGVIITGFLNVIGLSITLLSPIKINSIVRILCSLLFVVCVFLAGQRTPIGGVVIVLLVFLLKFKGKGILGAIVLLILLSLVYSKIDYEIDNISVKEVMTERYVGRFDQLKSGDSNRGDQYVNNDEKNVLQVFLGCGVGKHSPENPYSTLQMPDAMLNRIYNEMGIFGLSLFLLFFLVNMMVAIKRKDGFMIAFIAYVFFANMFNRVLFIAPTSILPYMFIALFNWHKNVKLVK